MKALLNSMEDRHQHQTLLSVPEKYRGSMQVGDRRLIIKKRPSAETTVVDDKNEDPDMEE